MNLLIALALAALSVTYPWLSSRHDVRADWAVSIELDGERRCGGALLSEEWVLTARHCVDLPEAAGGGVAPGRLRVVNRLGDRVVVEALEHAVPPYESLADLRGSDLALLRLAGPLRRGADLVLATPQPGDERAVAVLDSDRVSSTRIVKIGATEVYAAPVICTGDSGSPLLDSSGRLIGIASWRTALSCDEGLSVFNRVDVQGMRLPGD